MVLVSVLRSSAYGASFVDSDVCVQFDALKKTNQDFEQLNWKGFCHLAFKIIHFQINEDMFVLNAYTFGNKTEKYYWRDSFGGGECGLELK